MSTADLKEYSESVALMSEREVQAANSLLQLQRQTRHESTGAGGHPAVHSDSQEDQAECDSEAISRDSATGSRFESVAEAPKQAAGSSSMWQRQEEKQQAGAGDGSRSWSRWDPQPPPSLEDALKWNLQTSSLISDLAPQSATSTKEAFPDDAQELHEIKCQAHSRIWMNKESNKLVDRKVNAKKIKNDFQSLQSSCLSVSLNDIAFDRMIQYWKDEYKEELFATEFKKAWGFPNFNSRVHACRFSIGKAAIPNHNNGIEGHNGADKEFFSFERPAIVRHLIRMEGRIKDKSWIDREFGAYINCKAWNGVFWSEVHKYLSNEVKSLNIVWHVSVDEEHGNGSTNKVCGYIFPASSTILEVTNSSDWKVENKGSNEKKKEVSVRKVLSRKIGSCASWIDTYKHLLSSPQSAINGAKTGGVPWDFHLMMHWMNSFRLLILVEDDDEHERLIQRWEHGACSQGKASPAEVDRKKCRSEGVCRCRCAEYLLRGW